MAANNILPFGATASNELTQAAYAAEAQRLTGNQPGKASSKLVNKVLHQTNLIASGVAQFLADRQSTDVADTLTPANIAAMLATVFNGPNLLTTPPQFDNDASPATTGFVQRALGSYSAVYSLNAVQNITAAQAGAYTKFSVTAAGSVALPNDVPAGTCFTITNATSSLAAITITALIFGSVYGTSTTTYVMQPGTQADFVSFGPGSGYDVINGAGQAVKAGSGYQRLPSGVLLQWGSANLPASGANTSQVGVTFPIAFPVALYTINTTPRGGISVSGNRAITSAESHSVAGFNLVGDTNNGAITFGLAVPVFWTAIGA